MSDPAKYRTKEEVEERKQRDALTRLKNQLVEDGHEERVSAISAAVEAEVNESIRFAEESAEPSKELLEPVTYVGAFAR